MSDSFPDSGGTIAVSPLAASGLGLRVAVLAVALASAMAGVASAADRHERFAIDGAGLATCERFVAAAGQRKTTDYLLYAGWVDGYITAMNQSSDETFDYTPWQTTEFLLANLKAYCENHPETRFFGAVNAMLASLRPERLTAYSEALSVGHGEHTVLIYRSVLEKAMSALRRRGYLQPGDSDHAAVSAALEAFQRDSGLPTSGLPDARTLFALFGKQPG